MSGNTFEASALSALIDRLAASPEEPSAMLTAAEFTRLLENRTPALAEYIFEKAREVSRQYYGNKIYIRGLVEFSSYCKNDCYYCGLRRSNLHAERYRLGEEEILSCCAEGYRLGFRTFVLQGGEDPYFTDERMVPIVRAIRERYPDCAITLSLGERSRESYKALYAAGANRYLLRHETADEALYQKLHPAAQTLASRKRCLRDLKETGFQVGAGFMVGAPGQMMAHLAEDLLYLHELQPEMVGIGPFIPHHDTPFAAEKAGTLELTLTLLGLTRLMLPRVLLPATTALGTIHPEGRELGVMSGANVIMPNLSPGDVRPKYLLYDNKVSTGDEAAQAVDHLKKRMEKIGYQVVEDRGDFAG